MCVDPRVDREKNLPEYNKGFIIKTCGESCRIMEKGAVRPEVLMKYVYQFMIIAGISFLGELLNQLLPLPVPGSVYGLLILFFCLLTKIIRLDQVEDVGGWLLSIMPICFIAVSASMMTILKDVLGSLVQIFVIAVVSTLVVMVVTGKTAQFLMERKKDRPSESKQDAAKTRESEADYE
jgi:holin-like protein